MTTTTWAQRISDLRQRRGWTLAELANRLSVKPRAIIGWEAGVLEPESEAMRRLVQKLEEEPVGSGEVLPWSGRVRALRARVGMTQPEFAEALGLAWDRQRNTAPQISRWESGVVIPSPRWRREMERWERDLDS